MRCIHIQITQTKSSSCLVDNRFYRTTLRNCMDLDTLLKNIPGTLVVIPSLIMLCKVKVHLGFPLIERIQTTISIEKAGMLFRVRWKGVLRQASLPEQVLSPLAECIAPLAVLTL